MPEFSATTTAEQVLHGLDLSGKTYLLTGCNSGLGLETLRVMTAAGARVIAAARTVEKSTAACSEVAGDTTPLACELGDPASVRAAVEAVQEPLDGIIANAGIMALQTRQLLFGVEAHLFVNHVGHFILVTGLLDRLRADARVAMLSSGAHHYAPPEGILLDDLAWSREYSHWPVYGQSKLANILFARELSRRLPAGQVANALHPGVIYTPLWRHIPSDRHEQMKTSMTLKTLGQGAATQVYVAAHPDNAAITGAYFADCAVKEPSALAQDDDLAARLWQVTEDLVATL